MSALDSVDDDQSWKTIMDADTLVGAEEIHADGDRYSAAMAELVKRKKATEDAIAKNKTKKDNPGNHKKKGY